jgi:hypothetical protein
MFASVAVAAGKSLTAWVRSRGIGGVARHWEAKAAACERCPLRWVQCGVSYCGKPFLQQIDREPSIDGCGCQCHAKAKSPGEHCPLDSSHRPARQGEAGCNCKWCEIERAAETGL